MSGNHNSGPARGANLPKAHAAWGPDIPAWVVTLANACDRSGQRQVAETLGISAGQVSRILSRTYPGRYEPAELAVRSVYDAEIVQCPAIADTIPLSGCVRNRRRKPPARNHLQQLFARHCQGCPLNTDRAGDDRAGDAP